MKPSFKTTTLIAAIGMIGYTLYVLTNYAIRVFGTLPPYHFDLWEDIRVRLIIDILPISLIIAGIGLWNYRPAQTASKTFRIFTICLFCAMTATLLFSCFFTVRCYLNPSIYWRALILVAGIVWLFMLMRQPLEQTASSSYRVTLIFAMITLALPIVLEMISGLSLACGGEIFCFKSYVIKTWVRWIAPVMVLAHFVFPQIKRISTTRNSHCTPDSYAERTFHRNRAITIWMVGLTVLSFALSCFFVPARDHLYFRLIYIGYSELLFQFLQILSVISLSLFCLSGIIAWIMLSIMAFRQLPNPLGYRIFNIVFQVLTWGSLLISFFVSNGTDEILALLFFLSFMIFFVITSIRVISYSLPPTNH